MESSNQEAFFQVMATLDALYEKEPNIILAEMVFKVMAPYSLEEFTNAVERHIGDPKGGAFYPKPADLIKAIQGDTNKAASKAWQGVMKHLVKHGGDFPFKSDDIAVTEALDAIGGWYRLDRMITDDIESVQKQFSDNYNETKAATLQLINEVKKLEH